jgi:hypothetical protein
LVGAVSAEVFDEESAVPSVSGSAGEDEVSRSVTAPFARTARAGAGADPGGVLRRASGSRAESAASMMSGASPSGAIGAGLAVVRRERAAGPCAAVGFAADFAAADFAAADRAAADFAAADFAAADFAAADCAPADFAAADFAAADFAAADFAAPDFAPAVYGAAGSAASCFVVADFARLEGRFAGASASAAPAEARGVRRTAPGPADAAFDGSPSAGLPPSDGGSAVLIRFLLKA